MKLDSFLHKIGAFIALGLFVGYLIITLLIWHFKYWTGQGIIKLGFIFRDWIDPELGHKIFINILRWTYWQPNWVDHKHDLKRIAND